MPEKTCKFDFTSFGYSVIDVANFFLAIEKHEIQEQITHLKLQKLVYYSQGASLAFYKKTLFNEEIQAWLHGPVCPKLYEFFGYKNDFLDLKGTDKEKVLSLFSKNKNVEKILMDLWRAFGSYSGSRLENMTHQETTWLDAIRHGKSTVITPEAMYNYFVQFLPEENL